MRGSLHRYPLCHAGLPEQGMRSVWILFLTARCAAGAKNVRLRRNLEKRINRHAPLFADELIARELAERPDYFQGK